MMRGLLNTLGKYGPKQSAERLRLSLQQAGNPGNITPVMFSGIRLALAVLLLVVFSFVTFRTMVFMQALMYTAIGAGSGLSAARYLAGAADQEAQEEHCQGATRRAGPADDQR